MAEERSKDADKLYAPIRDQIVDAPEVADALKMEPLRKAYERARQITTSKAGAAKLRGAGDGAPALPAYADLFAKDGTLKKPLTLGQLDQIKRGLDDMLETAPRSPADAGGLGNEGMGALRDLKNAYVGVLDAAVPEYAQARQTFAGHSEMIRAFELGQKLYSTSPDKSSALLAEMSRDAQDAFRKGAVEATAQRVENITPGNSVSLRIGDRTLDRQRLRLLFPDDDSYNAFRSSLAQEALAHATKRNVLGNSATVDKLAEYADLAGVDLGSVLQHAEAGPKGSGRATPHEWRREAQVAEHGVEGGRLGPQAPRLGQIARGRDRGARGGAAASRGEPGAARGPDCGDECRHRHRDPEASQPVSR
jgi:hypothetical protein